jgi:hypothetical protein
VYEVTSVLKLLLGRLWRISVRFGLLLLFVSMVVSSYFLILRYSFGLDYYIKGHESSILDITSFGICYFIMGWIAP